MRKGWFCGFGGREISSRHGCHTTDCDLAEKASHVRDVTDGNGNEMWIHILEVACGDGGTVRRRAPKLRFNPLCLPRKEE